MIGDSNPVPTQVGGGPSQVDQAFDTLKRMVGAHGASDDPNSIEYAWRLAKAYGLAALATFDERAALQVFPHIATDHVPVFEDILGIIADESQSLEQRRQTIVPDYTSTSEAWTQGIQDQIQAIDERADVLLMDWVNASTTWAGKYFQAFDPVPGEEYDPNGSRLGTQFPNYSDLKIVFVLFDIGNGSTPSADILLKTEQMTNVLNEVIPSDRDFRVIYATGFSLGASLLDATGFDP